jgi:hypothetical protein
MSPPTRKSKLARKTPKPSRVRTKNVDTPPAATPPDKQIAGFLAKFDPALAKKIQASRAILRKRFPTAVEIVYDNYNFLVFGFATTDRPSSTIVALAAHSRDSLGPPSSRPDQRRRSPSQNPPLPIRQRLHPNKKHFRQATPPPLSPWRVADSVGAGLPFTLRNAGSGPLSPRVWNPRPTDKRPYLLPPALRGFQPLRRQDCGHESLAHAAAYHR